MKVENRPSSFSLSRSLGLTLVGGIVTGVISAVVRRCLNQKLIARSHEPTSKPLWGRVQSIPSNGQIGGPVNVDKHTYYLDAMKEQSRRKRDCARGSLFAKYVLEGKRMPVRFANQYAHQEIPLIAIPKKWQGSEETYKAQFIGEKEHLPTKLTNWTVESTSLYEALPTGENGTTRPYKVKKRHQKDVIVCSDQLKYVSPSRIKGLFETIHASLSKNGLFIGSLPFIQENGDAQSTDIKIKEQLGNHFYPDALSIKSMVRHSGFHLVASYEEYGASRDYATLEFLAMKPHQNFSAHSENALLSNALSDMLPAWLTRKKWFGLF